MAEHKIPTNLTSGLGDMFAPVMSIYFAGDTPDIVLTDGVDIVLTQGSDTLTVLLPNQSTTQAVAAITKGSLQYQGRVLHEIADLSSVTLTLTAGDETVDGGQIIRAQGHVVQRLEDTQIRILPPYNDSRYDPWYIVINTGWVSRRFAGGDWKFTVPEYSTQTWSPLYGTGFIALQDVIAERLGPRSIGVARAPIHWDRSNITLRVRDQVQPSSVIRDVDVNNGVIYLNRDYDENETVLVDYTYREDGYVYQGYDLNPTEFHNPAGLDRYVLFYLLPYTGPDGILRHTCVRHVESSTLIGALNIIPRTGEPIMVLGAAQVRQVHDVTDVQVTDTRQRGGGVKWDRFDKAVRTNRETLSTADRGFYDGRPYAGNMALFLRLPNAIRDTFEKAELDGIIKRFAAFGTYFIVEFE